MFLNPPKIQTPALSMAAATFYTEHPKIALMCFLGLIVYFIVWDNLNSDSSTLMFQGKSDSFVLSLAAHLMKMTAADGVDLSVIHTQRRIHEKYKYCFF